MRMANTAAVWLGLAAVSAWAATETVTFDAPETAAIAGYRALWDVPVMTATNGVRVVQDEQLKDRGATAPFAVEARAQGTKPATLAFDAVHRSLLVRFPGAAETLATKLGQGFEIEKAELVLPFVDEELWPEGNPNGVPPGGGYCYRANWGTDTLYRRLRPAWHAIAWGVRQPWKADPQLGPTYNAFINGAGYWAHFGAQDEAKDRVPLRFGPTPVSQEAPVGRMDVTAALNDSAFGESVGARLRRLADCGFLLRKWETYDARFFTGCYEWSTGTGPRAIIVGTPSLVVTLRKRSGGAVAVEVPPPADIGVLAAQLKAGGKGGRPTAVMPTPAELKAIEARFRLARRPDMPEWQWERIQELLAAVYGAGTQEDPFWFEFVPSHIKNRLRVGPDGKWAQTAPPDPAKVYEAYVDEILGKPYRGWNGFEAGPVLTTWFVYREALPAPALECFRNSWEAWLMPDRETSPELLPPIEAQDGKLVHPMYDQLKKGANTAAKIDGDSYYAKTGDWRGNKSFYRSGFNYTMSTMNFNNTASMGALLGGAVIGSERAIADGRHGQATYPLRLWTWFDGTAQEEGDDYYFGVTMRAQKMVADFGPDIVDRLLGRSMLLKGVTMLADDYHPGLRRYVTGASRTAPYMRLVTQDGLYGILHTLSRRGALTDMGLDPKALPEGEAKFGQEFPPEQVARGAAYSSYAPLWYQQVIDEKPLPYEVTAAFKRWGGHAAHPIMKRTYLGRTFGVYTMSAEEAFIPAIAQWRRQDREATTSRDLGTMLMRMGVNQTRFVNDAPGWIQSYGNGAILQSGPRFIASYSPWGAGLDARMKITSVQASLAFYNYELPAPTWELYVGGRRVAALPATCKAGTPIVIRNGVTCIGIVPLPGSDLGRTNEVILHAGTEQTYLDGHHHATAALVIDNVILQRSEPLPKDFDWGALDKAATGFAVEFADCTEDAGAQAFVEHMNTVKVTSTVDTNKALHEVAYVSGGETLEMGASTARETQDVPMDRSFAYRRVNGRDPDLPPGMERVSPFSMQGSSGRLALGGARLQTTPGQMAVLQREPHTGTVLAANPLAELTAFRLETPGGVEVTAAGRVGVALVTVEGDGLAIDVQHAFLPEQAAMAEAAEALLVFGLKPRGTVTLNGQPVALAAPVDVAGRKAVVVPLRAPSSAGPVRMAAAYGAAMAALEQASTAKQEAR